MDDQLKGLADALRALRPHIGPECPIRRIEVFLWVFELEPATLAEIKFKARAPAETIHADLKALGKRTVDGRAGRGLVTEVPNASGGPHTYSLSPRGRQAIYAMGIQVTCANLPDEDDEALGAFFEAKRHTRG